MANRRAHGEGHAQHQTPEYKAWTSMKQRCTNPKCHVYHRYGGRGISICLEWMDSYEAFLAHMGRRPTPAHSVDRIDNNRDYTPDNTRWATSKEQTRNRANNRLIEFRGNVWPLAVWAERIGITPGALKYRLDKYGWSTEQALTTPGVKKRGNLSPAQVIAIQMANGSQSDIARRFNLRHSTIWAIKNGRHYANVVEAEAKL